MHLCQTCQKSKQQIVTIKSIDKIRSDLQLGADFKIAAAVSCSGNPSSSSRPLKIYFEARLGDQEWNGVSAYFRIYHHRGRITKDVALASHHNVPRTTEKRAKGSETTDKIARAGIEYLAENLQFPSQHLAKHKRLLQITVPSLKILDDDDLCAEILPHFMEIVSADATGGLFTEANVHTMLSIGKEWLRTEDFAVVVDKDLIVNMLEYMLTISSK